MKNSSVSPVGEAVMNPPDQSPVERLQEEIVEKNKKYKPEGEDAESEFTETEKIGWVQMATREMSGLDKVRFAIGAFCATCIGAALPSFCLVFGEMIDGVADTGSSNGSEGEFNSLQKQAFYMLYIGIGLFFIGLGQVSSFTQFGESIGYKTQITYFRSCLEKDAYFYDTQSPTEMASKITKEIGALKKGMGTKVGNAIQAGASFFLGFAFSFYWGWLMNCILLAFVPVIIFAGVLMAAALQSGLTESLKAYSQSAGYAEQALQAIKIVHTYGQEKLEEKNFMKYLSRSEKINAKSNIAGALGFAFVMASFLCFYAYSFYFGGYLRWNQILNYDGREYSGGVIVTIMFSTVFGAATLGTMAPHSKAIAEAQIAGKLAYDTIDHVPKIKVDEKGTIKLDRNQLKGRYVFKDVDFTYPTRQEHQILKKFSCVFEEGKTTALVGPSGSGKSTIIQLLERFYDPTGGSISLDGVDIKQINLRSMRQLIGYVGQEPVLFNASIKENMLFAKPDANESEIIDALKAANAYDFIIKNMSEGINTQVGGGGGQLSGGQKQRIAIARAFLKQPKIILLDEATSALDKMNEKAIQEAIDNYKKKIGNITTIVIAHRLSTIRDADKIVVLKNGELVEMGNHEELLEQYPEGVYSSFCKKQESAEANSKTEERAVEATEERAKETTEAATVKIDSEIDEKKAKADAIDKKYQEELDKQAEENEKISGYTKLAPYNKPVIFIVTGTFGALISGSMQPILGIVFAKLLSVLSLPIEFLKIREGDDWADWLKGEVTFLSMVMIYCAIVNLFSILFQKYSYGYLGNNVTMKVREILYTNILQKHIGWFDERENGPSVLTSTMSADAAVINGVGGESLGPTVESAFGMIIGIGIAYYFQPLQATVCLLISPIMIIGASIDMQMMKADDNDNKDSNKEANLLCGDCIVNYKTVQSFGNEETIIKKYEEHLMTTHKNITAKGMKSGAAFGCSQLSQYIVFGVMFFFGGLIIKNSVDKETGEIKVNAEDVFIALFAIMFGANAAGNAASFGPDMEKAEKAAKKIFKIIEEPSLINAVKIDDDKTKKSINLEQVRGEIEFKDVWFRYPTRKEDFVLRGLNIKINPKDQVALVGESGCGKSTFVNLMMRFYDPDFGEVLLDGVNIKEYNLHDLRKAISLVMQEPIIFNYTILENILYGKLDAKNSEVYNATTISNANEFIEGTGMITGKEESTAEELLKQMEEQKGSLVTLIGKEKYDEELDLLKKMVEQEKNQGKFVAIKGDVDVRPEDLKDKQLHEGFEITCGLKGNKLSGGQKQRVAIARTIIRQPKVLLLDEATSALDEDSQKKVQGALEAAMEGRTTIIIAHRMSTIEKCNKIFVLEQGKVIEEGGFEELAGKDGGFFSNLKKGKQNEQNE